MAARIQADTGHRVQSCDSQLLRLFVGREARPREVYDLFILMDPSYVDEGGLSDLYDPWTPVTTDVREREFCGRFRITTYRRTDRAVAILDDVYSERAC